MYIRLTSRLSPLGTKLSPKKQPSTTQVCIPLCKLPYKLAVTYPSSTPRFYSTTPESPHEPDKEKWIKVELHKISEVYKSINRWSKMYQLFFLCILAGTVILYIYREKIRSFFGHQTAQVATITMEHEAVKDKVSVLSKEISQNLLDYYTKDEGKVAAIDFIKSIIEDQRTKDSVVSLVNDVLNSPQFNDQAVKVASHVSQQVLQDSDVLKEVQDLFIKVLRTSDTSQTLVVVFGNLFNDPKLVAELEVLGSKVIANEQFNQQVAELAEKTSDEILSNPELTKKMSEFLSVSVDDPRLKEEVGKALWEAIKVALLPSLVRANKTSTTLTDNSPLLRPTSDTVSIL